MQTGISPTPLPIEATFDEETRAFLAYMRNLPIVSDGEDPNDWLSQICANLRRSPSERLAEWADFADWSESFTARRKGLPHVEFSPRRVLRILTDAGVVFVFVGMGAGYLQGAPYPTYNTDITPKRDPENLIRVEHALRLLDSRPRESDQHGSVHEHDMGFRRLMTSAGAVNVVDVLPEVGGYEQLMEHADLMDLGDGLAVHEAALEDVIRSKTAVVKASQMAWAVWGAWGDPVGQSG